MQGTAFGGPYYYRIIDLRVHYPKILESATGKWYNSYNECDG